MRPGLFDLACALIGNRLPPGIKGGAGLFPGLLSRCAGADNGTFGKVAWLSVYRAEISHQLAGNRVFMSARPEGERKWT